MEGIVGGAESDSKNELLNLIRKTEVIQGRYEWSRKLTYDVNMDLAALRQIDLQVKSWAKKEPFWKSLRKRLFG